MHIYDPFHAPHYYSLWRLYLFSMKRSWDDLLSHHLSPLSTARLISHICAVPYVGTLVDSGWKSYWSVYPAKPKKPLILYNHSMVCPKDPQRSRIREVRWLQQSHKASSQPGVRRIQLSKFFATISYSVTSNVSLPCKWNMGFHQG